jgi:AcrR family transcriptional regulator
MTVQRADRRSQIVIATCRAIARDGVAAMTTRKIASEAGVNLATLHSLFGSKDALLVAVFDEVTGILIEALPPPAQGRRRARAALVETSAALWALADREPRLPLVRCELLLYLQRRPAHAEEARAQQRRYLAALADQCRGNRAGAGGRAACQTLAQLVASHVDGLALHAAFLEPTNRHRQIRAKALRAVLTVLEEGVPPRPARTPPRAPKRSDRRGSAEPDDGLSRRPGR